MTINEDIMLVVANNKNILEKLQTLKDLFDKKLITEDDYNQKRKDVLNSL